MAQQKKSKQFINRLRQDITKNAILNYPFAPPYYWGAFTFSGV